MESCNAKRLSESIEEFRRFGATINGGVTRLALSVEDVAARQYFEKCCRALQMTVKYDDMGNIYALLPGKQNIKPIVMGSHLDTVEKGGAYDGVLGVLTALEVVRTVSESEEGMLETPLMIVNFTNEEGARFDPAMMSSGVLTNKFTKEKIYNNKDKDGVLFEEALKDSGFLGEEENRLKDALAYLELHIEQGPVLVTEEAMIGVVEGVVGMKCFEITVLGESDHAGTTPMAMRRDALFVAAKLITQLRQTLSLLDRELVYTMGRLNVEPNIHTVIPNKVVFTVEARHQDIKYLKQVQQIIEKIPSTIEGCSVKYEKLWERETVVFDEALRDTVEKVSEDSGYKSHRMYSGAGHDAQYIANIIPSTMIFVPSMNGKSHCEEEFTSAQECASGANVLLKTVRALQEQFIASSISI